MLSLGTLSPQPSLAALQLAAVQPPEGSTNPPLGTAAPTDGASSTQPGTAFHRKPGLKAALGDQQNLRTLGQKLNELATRLGVNATPQAVRTALQSTPLDIHADSSYATHAGTAATLASFIGSIGLGLPTSHFSLTGLADSVGNRAQEHPLGNLGGGLSWPVPLSVSAQRAVLADAMRYASFHPNSPQEGAATGVLEFLNHPAALSAETLQEPAKVLETLVSSVRGQGLGRALQTKLNGISSDTSVNEYALTAMNLALDPESIAAPHRNQVAGFDLAQTGHWGKPASAVLDGLGRHLAETGKSTPEMAKAGAYLLLARKAPEFLVKDIPDSVTFGSSAWVSLAIAAATLEAMTPGKVPSMTFTQVMSAAQNADMQNPAVTQRAQASALMNWGVANGIVPGKADDHYSPADLETVRAGFNQQMAQRMEASGLLETEIPSRKDIALAKLKERFGENVPFEEKLLKVIDTRQPSIQPLYDPNRAPAGRFSMLDIAMSALERYKWESDDPRILEATAGKSLKLDVNSVFDTQYTQAITARKAGIGTTVKHLIAQLPLADRQHLASAKLEFFQKKTYTVGLDFTTQKHKETDKKLLMKASADHHTVYEIDLHRGVIKTVPASELTTETARQSNTLYKTESFTPTSVNAAQLAQTPDPGASVVPASFSSSRTQAIADAFVEHLDIDSADVKTYARGATAFDKQMATEWNVTNFFLDLIPLRSAIVNFQQGNYLDGATDLALDVFGFVTAGAGAAAKVSKVASKSVSLTTKALKVAKIIGTTTVSAFNPLDGLRELVLGGASLAGKGINTLKGATGNYDVLKAARADYSAAAVGTTKASDQTVETAAVLNRGEWYAFDTLKKRPYGPPLDTFAPLAPAVSDTRLDGILEWVYRKLSDEAPTVQLTQAEFRNFQAKYNNARQPATLADFELGFDKGNPKDIPGYSPELTVPELQRLSQHIFSPQDMGSLMSAIRQKKMEGTFKALASFEKDITAAGGKLHSMPQDFYLGRVNILSAGECAGIANAMGLALSSGKQRVLLENFYTAAAKPNVPGSTTFIKNMEQFQAAAGDAISYHMGKPIRQVPYTTIIKELSEATASNTLRIGSTNHALLAGVNIENGTKQWFYFDPNYGHATFDSVESMQNALERTLNRGTSPHRLHAYNADSAIPEYKVSDFDASDLTLARTNNVDVSSFSSTHL